MKESRYPSRRSKLLIFDGKLRLIYKEQLERQRGVHGKLAKVTGKDGREAFYVNTGVPVYYIVNSPVR